MRRSSGFILALVLLLVAQLATAQGTTGAPNGRVEHEGSGLPGVTVTITSPSLQGGTRGGHRHQRKLQFPRPGEILNVFDESALINGNTSVVLLDGFNPFTETPVEGVHWEKGADFGNGTDVDHFQLPRTYRVSLGLKF